MTDQIDVLTEKLRVAYESRVDMGKELTKMQGKLTRRFNQEKVVRQELDTALIEAGKGDDIAWLLSEPHTCSDARRKAIDVKFSTYHKAIMFSGCFHQETNQFVVKVAMHKHREGEVDGAEKALLEIIPFISEDKNGEKYIDIFEESLNLHESYAMIVTYNFFMVREKRAGRDIKFKSLREILEYIHDNLYYCIADKYK